MGRPVIRYAENREAAEKIASSVYGKGSLLQALNEDAVKGKSIDIPDNIRAITSDDLNIIAENCKGVTGGKNVDMLLIKNDLFVYAAVADINCGYKMTELFLACLYNCLHIDRDYLDTFGPTFADIAEFDKMSDSTALRIVELADKGFLVLENYDKEAFSRRFLDIVRKRISEYSEPGNKDTCVITWRGSLCPYILHSYSDTVCKIDSTLAERVIADAVKAVGHNAEIVEKLDFKGNSDIEREHSTEKMNFQCSMGVKEGFVTGIGRNAVNDTFGISLWPCDADIDYYSTLRASDFDGEYGYVKDECGLHNVITVNAKDEAVKILSEYFDSNEINLCPAGVADIKITVDGKEYQLSAGAAVNTENEHDIYVRLIILFGDRGSGEMEECKIKNKPYWFHQWIPASALSGMIEQTVRMWAKESENRANEQCEF